MGVPEGSVGIVNGSLAAKPRSEFFGAEVVEHLFGAGFWRKYRKVYLERSKEE